MRFGAVQRLLLFGGGRTCLEFAGAGLARGLEVRVVTSERHAGEVLDGEEFALRLRLAGVEPLVAASLRDPAVLELVTGDTLGVSFGAAWIFTREFIDLFAGRLVNVHAAPLPRNRGAGGFSWRILRGDRAGALCLHLVDEGIDTGPVLRQEGFAYPDSCRTPAEFHAYTVQRNLPFLERFLDDVLAGREFTVQEQDESAATYFPRLNTTVNGWIDWSWDAREIERFICAFDDPYAGASTLLRGQPVRLRGCAASRDGEDFHPFMSGLVYRVTGSAVFVAARGGGLEIAVVEDQEGRNLVGEIIPGERLHTPQAKLDEARAFHAVYTAAGLKDGGRRQ